MEKGKERKTQTDESTTSPRSRSPFDRDLHFSCRTRRRRISAGTKEFCESPGAPSSDGTIRERGWRHSCSSAALSLMATFGAAKAQSSSRPSEPWPAVKSSSQNEGARRCRGSSARHCASASGELDARDVCFAVSEQPSPNKRETRRTQCCRRWTGDAGREETTGDQRDDGDRTSTR